VIGVIADTHDNTANVEKAVKLFKDRKVDFVIHLGDVVSPVTLKLFEGLRVRLIKGNCDGDVEALKKRLKEMDGKFYSILLDVTVNNKKIIALHGDYEIVLQNAIESQKYDYVLHGHTHTKRDEKVEKTRVINPGTHYLLHKENHFVVLLDPERDDVQFVKINRNGKDGR
jgi:hypothetical protein